jgi:dephospho-CoA kinase
MLKLIKIAVTGGIATGKTTACRYFEKLGAYVVDSDKVSSKLITKLEIRKKLVKLLGKDILEKGKINKEKIAFKVFKNKKKLKELENLLHPLVLKEIEKEVKKAIKTHKIFIVEMPLLFELKQEKFYDFVIVVTAKKDICKKRFLKKNFEVRIKKQMPIKEKIKKADFVIKNNSNFVNLKKQVNHFFEKKLRRYTSHE